MKKIALLFFLLPVFSKLLADGCGSYNYVPQYGYQNYYAPESSQCECENYNYSSQSYDYGYAYNSCASKDECEECDKEDDCDDCDQGRYFEFGAEWIYWKPFQDNIDFATLTTTTSAEGITFSDVRVLDPDFDHDSGFRLYGTYCCGCSDWRISVIFTRLLASANDSVSIDPLALDNTELELTNLAFSIFDEVDVDLSRLDSAWYLNFNYLDIDFGRCYKCGGCFDITPHFGLRGMWMKQKLNLEGVVAGEVALLNVKLRDQFDAFGLEGGLIANLDLCWGFYVGGYINTSVVYARIKTKGFNSLVSEAGILGSEGTITVHHLCPIIEGFIGLGFVEDFDCLSVDLHIGWEQHIIINANHFKEFDWGDLTLQGLTFGGGISF